jgi:glycine cleavage system H protein
MPNMKYTKDHEWIRFENDVAVIGITDHAQNALGDVVFVDLPEPGREVTAGEAVAVVESVKAASDVYAPLTGRVTEVNSGLVDEPALINSEPTGAGWFFKITPEGALPEDLMDSDAYAAFVESLA